MKGIQYISLSNQLTRGIFSVLNIEVVPIIGFHKHELLVIIFYGKIIFSEAILYYSVIRHA